MPTALVTSFNNAKTARDIENPQDPDLALDLALQDVLAGCLGDIETIARSVGLRICELYTSQCVFGVSEGALTTTWPNSTTVVNQAIEEVL